MFEAITIRGSEGADGAREDPVEFSESSPERIERQKRESVHLGNR